MVARAGHAGLLDNGTGQARPLRSLFLARPRPGLAGALWSPVSEVPLPRQRGGLTRLSGPLADYSPVDQLGDDCGLGVEEVAAGGIPNLTVGT